MRKYSGVLLIGLGGGLILIAIVLAIIYLLKKYPELSGESAAYISGFYIGALAGPLVIIIPSFFIIRAGRRMLNSSK